MALSQAARGDLWPRTEGLNRNTGEPATGLIWSGFLTLAIGGPWLWASGYLFGTDWPGPRHLAWPSAISASIPAEAVLATVASLISAQLTGRLFVAAVLFGAAFTAYRAVPVDRFVPRAAGSGIFVLNPFVFGRLHYGQLFLLAGYAMLPWVSIRLRELCREPTWRAGLLFAISMSLVAVFTPHLFLVSGVVAAIVLPIYVIATKFKAAYIKELAQALAVAVCSTAIVSSYWAVPLLMGRSSEAAVIGATGASLLTAYAAVPDQTAGLVPNLLALYGFWAENSGRFTSMKAFVPEWPVVLLILLAVCGIGVLAAVRRKDNLAPWTLGLVLAAVIALTLEVGISHPLTAGFVRWLDATVPLYRGMRDAGKWAAVLALVYSQLFGLGAEAVLKWVQKLKLPASQLEWLGAATIGLLLALPLYYGNGLLFGMHGEIKPSEYPAGWYAADRTLSSDSHPGRTLFLPWHEYMSFDFIQNQNRVVASPAPAFFSVPIVGSSNPEVAGTTPTDPEQVSISLLVRAGATGDWSHQLALRDIKYVLIAREVDWQGYDYLNRLPGLRLVQDYGSILLYRNDLVR